MDRSNGWERVASEFIASSRSSRVGVEIIRKWARALPEGAAVLDLGCGPGSPRSAALHDAGFDVHAVDAAPSLAAEYARRFPNARVATEAAEESAFFNRTFDGVLAWGLLFLLDADTQRELIRKVSRGLDRGGRFLFTAPVQQCTWKDRSTGLLSLSLGEVGYKTALGDAGLTLESEYVDEGDNHYYAAAKT